MGAGSSRLLDSVQLQFTAGLGQAPRGIQSLQNNLGKIILSEVSSVVPHLLGARISSPSHLPWLPEGAKTIWKMVQFLLSCLQGQRLTLNSRIPLESVMSVSLLLQDEVCEDLTIQKRTSNDRH